MSKKGSVILRLFTFFLSFGEILLIQEGLSKSLNEDEQSIHLTDEREEARRVSQRALKLNLAEDQKSLMQWLAGQSLFIPILALHC